MTQRIILASASPRRRALLASAGFDTDVRIPNADETWPPGSLEDGAIAIAGRKLAKLGAVDGLALAADTVVALGDEALGKPADAAEAAHMLRRLSGVEHRVITGFVVTRGGQRHAEAVVSRVRFRALSDADIVRYVATGECLDKAGAYGIQGEGGALVAWLEGSYTNIVGLPLAEVLRALERLA
jgi:septum formation protein